MADYLKLFETHSQYEAYMDGGDVVLPNVSHCISENEVHYNPIQHDYSQDYFTVVAKESGTITFTYITGATTDALTSMSYKKNDGEWVTTQYDPSNGNTINVSVNNGDKVQWKGINYAFYYYGCFTSDCHVDIEGNIMSLLYGDNFSDKRSLEGRGGAFASLFSFDAELLSLQIVSAENLALPATTLEYECYNSMFYGCTSLITAPKKLPATTLAERCYNSMFYECASLTTAPELPATTLADGCYFEMFFECTNLTTAPELPATTLANDCYGFMFEHCTSLNYIKAMFTTTPSVGYTEEWVLNVSSTGTFVKNSSATWDVTGVDGIPTGWTVETASADQTPSVEPEK